MSRSEKEKLRHKIAHSFDKARKAARLDLPSGPIATAPLEERKRIGIFARVLAFVEQPISLSIGSIVGGIVGILFAIPVLLVCDACLLLALHRSKAVADLKRMAQVVIYAFLFIVCGVVFIVVGSLVKANAQQFTHNVADYIVTAIKSDIDRDANKPTVTPPPPRTAVPRGQTVARANVSVQMIVADGAYMDLTRMGSEGEDGVFRAAKTLTLTSHLIPVFPALEATVQFVVRDISQTTAIKNAKVRVTSLSPGSIHNRTVEGVQVDQRTVDWNHQSILPEEELYFTIGVSTIACGTLFSPMVVVDGDTVRTYKGGGRAIILKKPDCN